MVCIAVGVVASRDPLGVTAPLRVDSLLPPSFRFAPAGRENTHAIKRVARILFITGSFLRELLVRITVRDFEDTVKISYRLYAPVELNVHKVKILLHPSLPHQG
jgi:hypothetical protein